MEYNSGISRPRAYIFLPVEPEQGVQRTLKWYFRQPKTTSWEAIGILVPHLDLIEGTPWLRRLRVRGIRVAASTGTPEEPVLDSFTGPLTTYHPAPTLEAAEQVREARGIVPVSGNDDWLRPWMTTQRTERLGGVPL